MLAGIGVIVASMTLEAGIGHAHADAVWRDARTQAAARAQAVSYDLFDAVHEWGHVSHGRKVLTPTKAMAVFSSENLTIFWAPAK